MNRVERIKSLFYFYLKETPKYEVLTKKSVDHPVRNDLMTINITFGDRERSVRYNLIATENEFGHCYFELNTAMYTGITEDKEEHRHIKDFELFINNIGISKECSIKLTRWYHGELNLDITEAMEILIEDGINHVIY